MENRHTKSKIVTSLIWKLMERGGTQGVHFVVQIILARLLMPSDYGLMAIVMTFTIFANVFVQSGFNTALIQKKNANEVDFSSVFYLSMLASVIIYVVLFMAAPFIAEFYENELLTLVLRVLSLTLFIGALNSIQNSFVARNMMFKKLFFSSLGAVIFSGIIGVTLAYMGYGVWALVAQQLSNQFVIALILWVTIKWRPKLIFSIKRVKSLFSYGWKLLVSSLMDTFNNELRSLVIGKLYSPSQLGIYNRARQFPDLIVSNVDSSIQAVMFPAFSSQQDNKDMVKSMVRRTIVTSSFIIFPLTVGLGVAGEAIIEVLLTEKWLPSVPFLQIFCASYIFWPIHSTNLQAINAMGRSDIFLKLEIIKQIIGLIVLVTSLQFGIYGIAWGGVVSGLIAMFINAYPNRKMLNYSLWEQLKDITPILTISLVMGGIVYCINFLEVEAWKTLVAQVVTGAVIYLGLSILVKLEAMHYLINTFKEMSGNR